MAYKTINVKPSTYDRLLHYKTSGRSFDDVLRALMERVDPLEIDPAFVKELERKFTRAKKGRTMTHAQLLRRLGRGST